MGLLTEAGAVWLNTRAKRKQDVRTGKFPP